MCYYELWSRLEFLWKRWNLRQFSIHVYLHEHIVYTIQYATLCVIHINLRSQKLLKSQTVYMCAKTNNVFVRMPVILTFLYFFILLSKYHYGDSFVLLMKFKLKYVSVSSVSSSIILSKTSTFKNHLTFLYNNYSFKSFHCS